MTNGPIEPTADMRQAANQLRQMFIALTLEGFTETQALVILGHMLGTQRGGM